MGCRMFLSLAQATVLAIGPALKQEEWKSPFKAERPEQLKALPSTAPSLGGSGIGPRPHPSYYLGSPTKGLGLALVGPLGLEMG